MIGKLRIALYSSTSSTMRFAGAAALAGACACAARPSAAAAKAATRAANFMVVLPGSKGDVEDRLHRPAVGRVPASADADIEHPRRAIDVEGEEEGMRLPGARREAADGSEVAVIFQPRGEALDDAPRHLHRRREGRTLALVRAGEIEIEDRVRRDQPFAVAPTEDRPHFTRARRLLEVARNPRVLEVHAGERAVAVLVHAQRHPLEAELRCAEAVAIARAMHEREIEPGFERRRHAVGELGRE